MALLNTQLQTTANSIFVASSQQAITTMIFCNVSTQTALLNVFAVPSGGNASVNTQILKDVSLPAGETFSMDKERLVLEFGDAIYASSSIASSITSTISSVTTA